MIDKTNITIVIPAFNEEMAIYTTLSALLPIADSNNWQIIVIDDGSTDNTKSEIEKYATKVTLISHPYNKGYGASLKTGILAANTEYIALYDADGQHNPEDLLNLWKI